MLSIFEAGLGAFTDEQLDRLERYCDGLPSEKGGLIDIPRGEFKPAVRAVQVAPILAAPEIMWFFDRLGGIIREVNERSYKFHLTGLYELPQFLVYRDTDAGHYDWHVDSGNGPIRKLSVTIQLTDPARYDGCDLQFNIGTKTISAPRTRGLAVAFPSFTMHRVTPITSGVRKAIVAWVTGPEFK